MGVLKRYTREEEVRLNNKLKLLKKLRQSGIWLQDASIVALYNRGVKPRESVRSDIIARCWNHHIRKIIRSEKPDQVIVIGQSVYRTLENLPEGQLLTNWIKQPQGCRNKGEWLRGITLRAPRKLSTTAIGTANVVASRAR